MLPLQQLQQLLLCLDLLVQLLLLLPQLLEGFAGAATELRLALLQLLQRLCRHLEQQGGRQAHRT